MSGGTSLTRRDTRHPGACPAERSKRMARPTFRQIAFEYSEWLDSQGLVVSDHRTPDKRTHEELVRDFFGQRASH